MQTTRDKVDAPAIDAGAAARQAQGVGQRGHVFGAGPAVAWLREGGEAMLDGRVEKEFDALDRPKGTAFYLTLTRPF